MFRRRLLMNDDVDYNFEFVIVNNCTQKSLNIFNILLFSSDGMRSFKSAMTVNASSEYVDRFTNTTIKDISTVRLNTTDNRTMSFVYSLQRWDEYGGEYTTANAQDVNGTSFEGTFAGAPINTVGEKVRITLTFNPVTQYSCTITDPRDGQKYKVVKMPDGNYWTADNYRFISSYSLSRPAGTELGAVMSGASGGPDQGYDKVWGRYYSGLDIKNLQDAAETVYQKFTGTVIPTRDQWLVLIEAVRAENGLNTTTNGAYVGSVLKTPGTTTQGMNNTGWMNNVGGSNKYGFNLVPSGYFYNNSWYDLGYLAYYRTSTYTSASDTYTVSATTVDNKISVVTNNGVASYYNPIKLMVTNESIVTCGNVEL